MLLIEWLRSSATSTSATATAKAETDEGHEQCSDDDNDGNQNDEPVFGQEFDVVILFHIRTKVYFQFADNDVAWSG